MRSCAWALLRVPPITNGELCSHITTLCLGAQGIGSRACTSAGDENAETASMPPSVQLLGLTCARAAARMCMLEWSVCMSADGPAQTPAIVSIALLCRSPHKRWRMVVLDGYDISMLGWPEGHPNHAAAVETLDCNNPNQVQRTPVCAVCMLPGPAHACRAPDGQHITFWPICPSSAATQVIPDAAANQPNHSTTKLGPSKQASKLHPPTSCMLPPVLQLCLA